jgi:signal transduction histidine kinase
MIKNIITAYKKLIFGEERSFDVQKKVFLLITHITILIGFVGVAVDIILDLGFFLTLVTFLTVLVVTYFHVIVRRSSLKAGHSVALFLITLFVFPLLWFYNGGYDGNNIILIFVYFIVMVTILPPRLRVIAFFIYTFMIVGLTITHYYYPNLVTHYEDSYHRFIDLILGYVMYLVLAFSIQNLILRNYEIDRGRVNSQNDQLNNLVEQLNIAKNQLEQSLNSIKELNSAKDRFVSVLSHDLRSPFQGILGITKTLESDYSSFNDHEKKYFIGQVNKSLDKLYGFLEELLLWGRIQSNSIELKKEPQNIKSILAQILLLFSDITAKKKINVQIFCDDSLQFNLDKEMISVVIRNLLSNSIKFSPFGSQIDLSAEMDNEQLHIKVKDNGVGLSDEYKSKLFKLDEIISTAGTDGEQGTGMGLILCNDIIKKHNGIIGVESKEGKGTIFTVLLPAQ